MNYKSLFKYSATIFVWMILTVIYFHIAEVNVLNADDVSNILEARSIFNGNIFLHGWTLPPDTFYTLDTQIDLFFLWLGVRGTTILHLTPSVIYSSLVMLVYYIINKITSSHMAAFLSVALFIAFPFSFYKLLVTSSPMHVLTILFVTASFYLYYSNDIKNSIIYSSILLYLSIVGDPYAIFIGTLPILLYSSIKIFYVDDKGHRKINRKIFMPIMLASITATILAKITVYLIRILGGYTTANTNLEFVSLNHFNHNFYLLILGVLEAMQSNFFGNPLLSFKTFVNIIHAFMFAACLIIIISYYRRSKRVFENNDLVGLCVTSIFITCIAFLFSTEPVNIYTTRYLLDVPVFMSIAFGYLASKKYRYMYTISLLPAIIIAVHFSTVFSKEKPADLHNLIQVVKFLKINNLHYGLAGYWNAAPFTLLSNNNVKVRQVIVNAKGKVTPFAWLSNSNWYKNIKHPQFVIIGKHNNFGLTDSVAKINFGQPKKIRTISGYKILVY